MILPINIRKNKEKVNTTNKYATEINLNMTK